jgi:hypothetical protein
VKTEMNLNFPLNVVKVWNGLTGRTQLVSYTTGEYMKENFGA